MGYLANITGFINDRLKENSFKDKRFASAQYHRTATIIPFVDGKKVRLKLVSLDKTGDTISDDLMYSDNDSLHIFHIIKDSAWQESLKDDFGHHLATKRVTNVSLIAFAKRKAVELDSDDLDLLIRFGLPFDLLRMQNYGDVKLIHVGCDYNQRQIFQEEFALENYTMEPDIVLIRLKYRLECTVSPDCVQIICC